MLEFSLDKELGGISLFKFLLLLANLVVSFGFNKAMANEPNYNKYSFSYDHYQFVRSNTDFFRDEASSHLELFTFGFKQNKSWSNGWFSNADANLIVSPIEKKFYINAPEFYLSKKKNKSQVFIGRKLQEWSWSDSYWDNGHWEPRFVWEEASPDKAGLIGYHYNKVWSENIKSLFFVSPFYIPEFSAGSILKNGVISSKNPWFNPPVNLVDIPGLGLNPIFFEINKPNFSRVILRPSAGLTFRLGKVNDWVQAAYIYKPSHRLLTNFDSFIISGEDRIILDGDDTDVVESREVAAQVEVLPELFYHHLVSLESRVSLTKSLSLWTSYNYEAVDRDLDFNDGVTYKGLAEGHVVSAMLKLAMDDNAKPSYLSIGYMNLSGGDKEDGGARASAGKSLFRNHYRFKSAFKAEIVIPQALLLNKYFSTKSSLVYDLDFKGLVFSNIIDMRFNKNWSANLKIDLIGLVDDENIQKSFMSSFRSSDQISLGVSYAF